MSTRQRKSPAQRAAESLAIANRKVEKLESRIRDLETSLNATTLELADAKVSRDYAAKHPALAPATDDTDTDNGNDDQEGTDNS